MVRFSGAVPFGQERTFDLHPITIRLTREGTGGDGVFVAYSDIQTVKVGERSTAKTAGLVAAILVPDA